MRSNNPFLRTSTYSHLERAQSGEGIMTANGAANKASILILVVFGGSIFGWAAASSGASGLTFISAIIGFGLAIFTMFKPHIARITAPIYSVFQGLFLGGISFTMEVYYPGIASQAVIGTIAVFMVMMVLYRTKIVKVTDQMRSIVTTMIMGIAVSYLISFVMSMFTGSSLLAQGGTFGIIFSLVVIGVASFSILLDLDSIERAEQMGQPKTYEWFYAFSLLVTLIWLYLEILRFLSILRGRD